ncbi:MAG: type II secretion system inner membrane protein GspF [Marinomonas gallaica]
MAVFEYRALAPSGAKQKGVLEADNERHARQKLRDLGLLPLELHNAKPSARLVFQRRLSVRERALLVRQLATLIDAGLPIEEAISGAAAQSQQRHIRSMLLAIRARVLEGFSLAQALDTYPKAFPMLFRASVQAGEESGKLATVLLELSEHSEREQSNQQKLKSALLYPALLTLVAIAIVGFLLGSVMPDIVAVFERQKADLPTLTISMMSLSNWVVRWGDSLLVGLVIILVSYRLLLRHERFRHRRDAMLFNLPVIGRMIRVSSMTRYVSTLAMLFRSGVPLVYAMEIANRIVLNHSVQCLLGRAQVQVKEGVSLTKALKETQLVPPMMMQLIDSGERSGELAGMLDKAAKQQSEQSQYQMNNFITLFEPLMLLIMGAAVMLIVMAILLPIMNMNQLLN